MLVKSTVDDIEDWNNLMYKRCLALWYLLRRDQKYLQTYIRKQHTNERYQQTSKSGKSFSRRSHSFFDNWNRFRHAEQGRLCCSEMTNKLRASCSCSAHSKSSAVLFHLVATSCIIRTALILLLIQAFSRSARKVGLLNIHLARFCSCSDHVSYKHILIRGSFTFVT